MERSRDWLDQAEWDLAHAKSGMEREFYDWSCFSAQQAKAVFLKLGAEAWGHSVADLLSALSQRYTVHKNLLRAALELDKAYIPARHPNAHPSGSPRERYTEEEAQRLISHVERIIRFCKDLLAQA